MKLIYFICIDNYSEPLTDEQVFNLVMSAVRKELRKSANISKTGKHSFVKATAKTVIGNVNDNINII